MASKTKSNIVVSIVGPSNSGKSTFLNSTLGEKVSIVSRKVQTTRMGLRGILNNKNVQIIFIDTPGLFEAKTKFEKAMVENAFFNLPFWHLILVFLLQFEHYLKIIMACPT